ncbi:MAG: HEAT repeat domain-containing protein, partial [Armatimonadota bacterium]|nr:HEAT repeat domain-containing protein [Armatimonadota bacterium]
MLRRLFVSWWIRRLESRSWNVRLIACLVLGKIGDERAIEPLIDRLGDRDKDVRKAACEALEKLGEGRLARAVFGALKGKEEARKELAKLAKEGDYRAVKPLIEGLRYGSICSAACEALNAIFKTLSPLKEQMLCSKDLTRFEEKIAEGIGGIKAKYLACRVCGKISEIILGVKEVVAVLDEGMREETKLSDGV